MSLKSFASSASKRDVVELDTKRRRKAAIAQDGKPAQYPSTIMPRIGARVSAKSERRVRELALHEDTTVQALIVRGLSSIFVEHGLPPLEEVLGDLPPLDVAPRKRAVAKKKRA
jgi:hypothetical protein